MAFIESSKGKVISKTIGTPDRPVMRANDVVACEKVSIDYLRLSQLAKQDNLQLKSVETGYSGTQPSHFETNHSPHTHAFETFFFCLPYEVLCLSMSFLDQWNKEVRKV